MDKINLGNVWVAFWPCLDPCGPDTVSVGPKIGLFGPWMRPSTLCSALSTLCSTLSTLCGTPGTLCKTPSTPNLYLSLKLVLSALILLNLTLRLPYRLLSLKRILY